MSYNVDRSGRIIRNNIPVNNTPRNIYHSTPYTPRSSRYFMSPLLFYIITITVCAVASWVISANISLLIFNPSKPSGWFEGISRFFHNIGPYAVFLGGFAGCLWYNLSHTSNYNLKDIFLSFLSGILGCVLIGVIIFLLAIIIQIVVIILVIATGLAILGCGS